MKNRRFLAIICIMLAAIMMLSSCKNNDTGENADTTTAVTTTGSSNEEETPKYPAMDLISIKDFSQYLSIGDYKQLKITCNVAPSEEELDEQMLDYAVKYKHYTLITDRATAKGDTLDINFVGYLDGEKFEGGTANNATISLTENTGYIDGFDADLYGIMPGTTVRTTVVFPENYTAELAGKTAEFEITVNGICKYELTDENVSEMTAGEYTTVAAFRENIKNLMTLDNLKYFDSTVSQKIVEALEDVCKLVKVPDEQINYYYFDMIDYYKSEYEYYKAYVELYYGIKTFEDYLVKMYGLTDTNLLESAELYAAEDIIMIAVAKDMGLTLTDEQYQEGIKELTSQWNAGTSEQLIKAYGESYLRMCILKMECMEELKEKYVDLTTDYDEYKHLLEESEKSETEETTAAQ